MKTRIAILGVGRWGVHLVRNFLQHPQAKVIAIVDPNPDNLASCKEKLSLDENSIVMTTDWKSVRHLQGLDAVVIATPASTHYPLITDALQLGYHVLAEKPLTLDPAECLELCRLAQKKQLQLLVDHTYLFNSAVERGQQVIQSEQLGKLRYGYATRTHLGPVRQDVDALWDLAIHDLAIFNHWLGQTPIQVQARGTVWLQPELKINFNSPQYSIPHPHGLSDLVWLNLTYADGFCAYIHLCWLNPDKQRRLCVAGSQGTLIFDEMLPKAPLTLYKGHFNRDGERFLPGGQASEVIEIEETEPLKRVCDRFLENIRSPDPSSFSSGWEGAKLVQILTCLTESLQKGGKRS